jgi:hypothetical protein
VNGQMACANESAASAGTKGFARTIQHIELQWADLRVDPLTSEFAVVAAPWREIRVDHAGQRIEDARFFTGAGGVSRRPLAIPRRSLVLSCSPRPRINW